MNTYRHAGDLGDICFSLPVIKATGGGVLMIEAANYTRVRLTPDKWVHMASLLKAQPYIVDVIQWQGQKATFNLNDFRARMSQSIRYGHHLSKSLTDWFLETHGIPATAKDEPWLTVEPKRVAPVVFNRTGPGRLRHHIYHNPYFPWHRVWQKYGKDAVFIGLEEEWQVFSSVCGDVPFYRTDDMLEAAQIIAGATLFVGNQSLPHAIAQALHQNVILEVWREGANCCFERPGVINGWDLAVELPSLNKLQTV